MPVWMVIQQVAFALPEIIAWGVCLILAIVRYERHRPVSTLAAAASGLMILVSLSFAVFRGLLIGGALPSANMSLMYSATGVVGAISQAAAVGMLTAAAFGWRTGSRAEH